jgi:hypothetical protein
VNNPGKTPCVFDTNSLISALPIKESISRRIFDKALDYYQILLSSKTAAEFNEVAGRISSRITWKKENGKGLKNFYIGKPSL